MKKHLHNSLRALFLSLAVLLSLPMLAVEVEIDAINYDLNAETKQATVIKKSSGEYSGEVVIPESVEFRDFTYSVTSIWRQAFSYCSGLTSVTIPNSVTSIGWSAFSGCKGLTSITIPNSVTSIGESAFLYCDGLTSVHISDIAAWCNIDFADSDSNPLSYAEHLYLNGDEVKDLVIPNSVTSIGDAAFYGCKGLTSVTIPNSVTSIGDNAFYYCSSLTSVTIGNSVTSIGDGAFGYCKGLTSVHISDIAAWCNIDFKGFLSNPLKDAHHLYLNGEEVKDLVIPNSVTSIGGWAFNGCSGLTSVTIPNSVTSIGDGAFYDCSGLTSVTIPNSVTSIGQGAFMGCSGLTSVTIPNSVTSIELSAFSHCSGLTSVTIPNSVTSIGENAFQSCKGLTSVTIGNSVTSIGESAFGFCSVLTEMKVDANNPKYDSREGCNAIIETSSNTLIFGCQTTVIPNSVTSIGDRAFSGCSSLTSVTIPNSVTSIGSNAFFSCSGLTSVTIGNGVTSIGAYAFYDCSGLTSVTIPNSVTSIGNYAFAYCPELLDVYCYAENVPSTASNTFKSSPIENATLHVPDASVDSYKATEPWSSFENIVGLPNLTLTDGEEFENNTEQTIYTLTYTRTLPNMLWNPLYVPFKIPYEDLEENYEVAYINAMHSYDNDDNGEIDEMVMEIVKIKAGTLKPNHPYLIKAKNEEAKVMNIVQEAATLYPAEITTLDCSSVYTKFEITGTYQKMTSEKLNGSLVISTDGAWKKLASTSILKPFRFYLTISSREGSPVEIAEEAMSRVRIRVMGEDDNATGIDEVKTEDVKRETEIYDLSGRRVSAPAKGGVYIINGKKVIY